MIARLNRILDAVAGFVATTRQQLAERSLDDSFAGMFTQYGTLDLPHVKHVVR